MNAYINTLAYILTFIKVSLIIGSAAYALIVSPEIRMAVVFTVCFFLTMKIK